MAIYKFLPSVKLEITAEEWRIQGIDKAEMIAKVMSEKLSALIEDGWNQISSGKSFSLVYQKIEREFEQTHSTYLNISDMDCMKVFYKVLDNFFPREMVEKVQNTNLLTTKPKLLKSLT